MLQEPKQINKNKKTQKTTNKERFHFNFRNLAWQLLSTKGVKQF